MKPAPCSWRVRISLIFLERDRLSSMSRFSSPGTPKIYSQPSSSRHWMKRSDALVPMICSPWSRRAPAAPSQDGGLLCHFGGGEQGFLQSVARSEEHTSELQSLMRTPYAVFCLKKKKTTPYIR